jgi:S1-C subfamily serine protease
VILQINETAVVSRDAARDALADLAPERPFTLTVRRGDQHLAIEVPPAARR